VAPVTRLARSRHRKEITMFTPVTRRRFIEITPVIGIAGMTALAACSPKEESSAAKPPSPAPTAAPATAPAPVAAPAPATAASLPMLDEKAPQAMALGYVADASRADKVKFNNYVVGNQCRNCANFLGTAADSAAGCKIFPGYSVAAPGWCTAWLKQA
jgi:hypothetical protein